MKQPPGCERDLREDEYRQVKFEANFNSEPATWRIITSIMKNGNAQLDDRNPARKLIIDTPFQEYVDKKPTCVDNRGHIFTKPIMKGILSD
jgi:hypothetical protein